jgi:hypothetical protein
MDRGRERDKEEMRKLVSERERQIELNIDRAIEVYNT